MVGYENLIKESFSKFNIPYYIFGGKSFYYKPEIKAILSSLSAVQNPLNDFELTKYLMSLIVRMTFQEYHSLIEKRKGKESLFETLEKHKNLFNNNIVKGFDVLKKFKDLKYFLSPTNILKGIVNETDYLIYLSSLETTENAISNVKKMINEAEQYDNLANSFAELIKLLKNSTEVDEQEAVLEDEKSDSVKIMTIHKSKGLEFPIVILGGLHKAIKESRSDDIEFSLPDIDGNRYFLLKKIFEDSLKNTSDVFLDWFKNNDFLDFTENNRLIYVAVTRAKEMLIPVMVKNERSTSFNDFFKSVSYEKIDYIENSDIVSIKKDVIKENDDYGLVPEKNLTDFNHLAYKQYIAPTYLTDKFKFSEIRETEDLADFYNVNFYNSKNFLDNKNSFFDDQELLYKGSEIHLKLQSAINLSHIKNMVINKELPDGFDNLEIIKYAFDEKKKSKNEWRLMKKEVIDNKDFMLFGIVDKVVFDSNKITIIDFKYSNLTNKEKIEGYIFQIQFYMYLLKDFGDIDKGYIINVKTNEKPVIIEVAYNPDIKEIIYSKIKEL
jgi:ATP-dependent helicase/nuclease subunit A